MLFKFLRNTRVAVALGVFILITAQFMDMYHELPRAYYMHNPTHTQFVPSLLKMLGTGAVAATSAFVVFGVFALVFGRAYCSFFCAFGIFMDIISRSARAVLSTRIFNAKPAKNFARKLFSRKYRKPRTALRAIFLLAAVACITFGWSALLGFVDPYSLYGKIFGSAIRPAAALAFDSANNLAYDLGIYSVEPLEGDPRVAISAFGAALAILTAISLASIARGRLFCNTLCPVGAWLGLLAKFSLFKLSLDTKKCVSCGLCERNCKAECIDSKNKSLDFSRCVLCLDCAANCPKRAIKITPNRLYLPTSKKDANKKSEIQSPTSPARFATSRPDTPTAHSPLDFKIPRRAFAATAGGLAATLCAAAKRDSLPAKPDTATSATNTANISPYTVGGDRPDKRLTVPPGSKSIENFLEKCTGCQICTAACKAQILKPSTGEWGLSHIFQPYMDYAEGFCLFDCHSCSKACPTGAIEFITHKQKHSIKIGTAILDENLCVVKLDMTDCAACAEHCPVQAIETVPFGDKKNHLYIPKVHPEVCIGCGACESICPSRPHRAIVVEGLSTHIRAKKFDDSMRFHTPTQTPAESSPQSPFPF